MLSIPFIIFVGFVAYFIWKGFEEDNQKRYVRKTQIWQHFVYDIERKHFLYPLTDEHRNWVLSHSHYNYQHIEKHMPEDIKKTFTLYEFERG